MGTDRHDALLGAVDYCSSAVYFFLKEQQLFSETSLPTRIKKEENDGEPCLIRAATSSELKALKSDRLQVAGP